MDTNPLDIVHKVWRHQRIKGNVWVPSISDIGVKDKERFREGPALDARRPHVPELLEKRDWYWTPAVSSSDSRKAKQYPAQRAVWVDCDESYDDKLLQELKPTFMWETSPGHKQAVWLLKDPMPRSEYHRDGFIGMLTHALGGDKSGVDIGQLLRVPGTWHHKREPFHGKVLRSTNMIYTRGMLLSRVAKGLGLPAALASELGADDPYGDRSKLLWKFARSCAEHDIDQALAYKLLKACSWNKWRDEPEKLKEDIARAYEQQPKEDPEREQAREELERDDDEESIEAWSMASADSFSEVLKKPVTWIVPNIVPEAGCGLLVAPPKTGKSRIAIEIALGLATGQRPLGLSVRRPQAVGFFSLEDGEHLFGERLSHGINAGVNRQRFHWDGHIKQDLTWEPPSPMSLFTHFAPIDLSEPKDQQRLYMTIEQYGLRMVILDTLSMAIGKANVSDQKEMYAILKPLKIIAQTTGCAVMFIHHTRKRVFEKGESIQESILGATALHGWSDFIMSLAAPAEEGDPLRLGVQTKRGSAQHYISSSLRIIKRPAPEEIPE